MGTWVRILIVYVGSQMWQCMPMASARDWQILRTPRAISDILVTLGEGEMLRDLHIIFYSFQQTFDVNLF